MNGAQGFIQTPYARSFDNNRRRHRHLPSSPSHDKVLHLIGQIDAGRHRCYADMAFAIGLTFAVASGISCRAISTLTEIDDLIAGKMWCLGIPD